MIPVDEQPNYLEIDSIGFALRIQTDWLRPIDGSSYAEILYIGGLRFYSDWRFTFLGRGLSFAPCEIANTGIVIELQDIQFDFSKQSSVHGTRALGLGKEFQGIYARYGQITVLPESVFGETRGFKVDILDAAIGTDGITCTVKQFFAIEYDDNQIDPESALVGYLFEDQWQLAIIGVTLSFYKNVPRNFQVRGAMRIPPLEAILEATFGLERVATQGYRTSLNVQLINARTLALGPGSLQLDGLSFNGWIDRDGFSVSGRIGGQLTLPNFDITIQQAEGTLSHHNGKDDLKIALQNVVFDSLGTVERAFFRIRVVRDRTSGQDQYSFWFETSLRWSELHQRLSLSDLPENFPLPPDDAIVVAKLHWHGENWRISFQAQVQGLDKLWSFLPENLQPEVRSANFEFVATHQISNHTYAGSASVEASFRLPELPNFPGSELITVTTGDDDGWIEAAFGATILDSNTENSASLKASIANGVAISINFPGIPQNTPPIYIDITQLDLSLGQEGDKTTGRFGLSGDFLLRPINPADTALPLPPVMATHLERLFRPLTATPFEGKASLTVQFADDKAAMDLKASFTDASIEVDLFDMFANVTRGIPTPDGLDNPANSVDLDIDVGFVLHSLGIQIGSLEQSPTKKEDFKFEFVIDLLLMGQQIPICFSLSDQQVSFGLTEMTVPLSIPRFPFELQDMEDLVGDDDLWDYDGKWLSDTPATIASIDASILDFSAPLIEQIEAHIGQDIVLIEAEIDALIALLNTAKDATEQEIEALSSADNGDTDRLRHLQTKVIPNLNQEGLIFAAKKFMIQSVFAIYNLVGAEARPTFRTYFSHYQTLMDKTVGMVHVDTDLLLIFENVSVVLPFHDPSDVRVEGSARFDGFEADSPLAPLNDISLSVGLSADLIYLAYQGSESPLVLPPYEGRYEGTEVVLDRLRIGYGYNKNSFAIDFAGQLELPENLVQDADTSEEIGIGIRLPQESRLAFKLDLIPIVLGEVDFLLPLFKFDVDLRREGVPGIADPRTCEPYWDGLQLHIPGVFRGAYKRAQFSPFYGPLPAPNVSYSYDFVFGSGDTRMAFICDDYQQIMPVLGKYPIPFLADGTPYFENQCVNIRVAGFGLNLNLQRPMPSLSPLAVFEIIGLISDPLMPLDPHGSLAETMRITLQHAQISLPPAVVSMFPELGNIVDREVNYDLNLGTVIHVAQQISHYIEELKELAETQAQADNSPPVRRPFPLSSRPPTTRTPRLRPGAAPMRRTPITNPVFRPRPPSSPAQQPDFVEHLRQQLTAKAPPITASEILALLPPELRQIELKGSFIGFDATMMFLLLTPEELSQEFSQRSQPTFAPTPPTFSANPEEITPPDLAQLQGYQPQWPKHATPVHLPADPQNSLLASDAFSAFSDRDLQAINQIQPDTEASAIVVGGQVRIFEAQSYAFMGYVYTDGHFGLVSAANIEPLEVTVAGMPLPLPLQVRGRLALTGLANGVASYAKVKAEVGINWVIIPEIARILIGSVPLLPQPATFELDSRGHFAAKGIGRLILFKGATTVDGKIDISHTHCHIDGELKYVSGVQVYRKPLVQLKLTTQGRIGPGSNLKLSGTGSLYIAGNAISNVKGLVSTTTAEIEGQIDTTMWKMGNLSIQKLRLGLRGKVDLQNRQAPECLLEGDAYLRLFAPSNSSNRLEITGRGGVQADSESLTTFVAGKVIWQGQEWLQGQVRLHSQKGIHIEGYTRFGLILTPNEVGGVEVASLCFKLGLGGTVDISSEGDFRCDLVLDWDLGVQLPGNENQVLPLAADTLRLKGSLSNPVELLNLNGFKLLPLEGWNLTLPIPEIHGKGPAVLKLGTKNNLIAVDVRQVGTLYFDEYEFVTGLTGGELPSLSGGVLPQLSGGAWFNFGRFRVTLSSQNRPSSAMAQLADSVGFYALRNRLKPRSSSQCGCASPVSNCLGLFPTRSGFIERINCR